MSKTTESQNRPSAQALETRKRILQASLALFNEDGYSRVTTHHIASSADMSPGNLYYHFKNKEEIVREIFLSMEIFSRDHWEERGPKNPKESFLDFMRFFFGNLQRYRFFFREFSLIVQSVPAMEKLWKQRWDQLMETMRQAVVLWHKAGVLNKFSSQKDMDAFIETCWILANFSSVHREFLSDSRIKNLEAPGFDLLIRFLYPYHTTKGQRALDLYRTDREPRWN